MITYDFWTCEDTTKLKQNKPENMTVREFIGMSKAIDLHAHIAMCDKCKAVVLDLLANEPVVTPKV